MPKKKLHLLLSDFVVIVTFAVIVATTSVQVGLRYVFSYSLPWADELARYCLVWMVFVGMVSALVRGQHVTVDLLRDRYRGRLRLWAFNVIDAASAILFLALLYGSIGLMELTATQQTSGLGIPKPAVYAAVPVGAVLILIEYGLRLWRRCNGQGDEPGSLEAMTGI